MLQAVREMVMCQKMLAVDRMPEFVCQKMRVLVNSTALFIVILSNNNVRGELFIMFMSTAVVVAF
jgi:hypothetical protein